MGFQIGSQAYQKYYLMSITYNLKYNTDKQEGRSMEIMRSNRQASTKETIIKHRITQPKMGEKGDAAKKKEKNTLPIKSNAVDSLQREQRPKSNQKESKKKNEASFNDVVTKFKKLFDEKIKFVRDDLDAVTQRPDNKQKKGMGNDPASEVRMKKGGSSANLGRKNTSKQGFSQLISDIEAKLNMHRKNKQKQRAIQAEKQFISIEDHHPDFSTLQLKSLYKPKQKFNKSRQQGDRSKSMSKQKYGSTSRTISAIKRTQRINAFETVDQNVDSEKDPKGKSKNKAHRIESTKNRKVAEPIGSMTIRQKSSTNHHSGNLSQGKYKNRLKTFDSQQTHEIETLMAKQKIKNDKAIQKSKKQIGKAKNKELKMKEQESEKNPKEKRHLGSKPIKSGTLNKSKEKRKLPRKTIDGKQTNHEKGQKPRKKKLVILVENREKDKGAQPKRQLLFSRNGHNKVSSSPSENASKSKYSSEEEYSSVLSNSYVDSDAEKLSGSNNKEVNAFGSVIMYDIGQQGDLKFSRQIESDSEEQQGDKSVISQTQKWQHDNAESIMSYILGFRDYVEFERKRRLLAEFIGLQRIELSPKNQQEVPIEIENKEYQQKKRTNMEQALKEEELKWLNFKKKLERIKECPNFKQEIQKAIVEAGENHLALKLTQIIETNNPLPTNQMADRHKAQKSHPLDRYSIDKLESQADASEKTFKASLFNNQPQNLNNQNETSSLQSDFGATIRTPIRTQANQINININISDAEIKIKSPKRNYNKKNKAEKTEKLQKSEEVPSKNQTKIGVPPVKQQVAKINQQNIETRNPKLSLSSSDISLRNLVEQCYNQTHQNKDQIKQNRDQEATKEHKKQEVQGHIDPVVDNKDIFKEAEVMLGEVGPTMNKKKKLSYQQAPLQIKRIFTKGPEKESKEAKEKERNKLLLQSELDLSEFMSSKAIDQSLQNSSASNKNDKRIKILEEIKSPSNYHNVHHLFRRNHAENENLENKADYQDSSRSRIKISLFSSNNSRSNVSCKEYKSEGQLELLNSSNKSSNKSSSKNFILLKPKKVELLSQLPSEQGFQKKLVEEKQECPISPQKSANLNSQSWLIEETEKQIQLRSVVQQDPVKQRLIPEKNHQDPIKNHQDPINEQDYFMISQVQNTAEVPDTLAAQEIVPGIPQEEDEVQAENIFRKSQPTQIRLDSYNECELLIAQMCIGEFIAELVDVDEEEAPKMDQNGRWVYNKIGRHLISYYNSGNIEINEQNENHQQLMGSPYGEIKQYQPDPESAQAPAHPQSDEGQGNQKVNVDTSYIINLVGELFDFLESHADQYNEFSNRIKKPLGVDTLHLLKILRDNDIGASSLRNQGEGLEGELDQFFEPEDQLMDEDTEDYYIISLETLARFENQAFVSESNNINQQFFNQAVYDKVNMLLDGLRPYGTKGLPVLNFMHKYKVRDPATRALSFKIPEGDSNPKLNRHRPFSQIRYSLMNELMSVLKVRLGLLNFDRDSDKIIQYSFDKLVTEYALEMDEQWRTLNDGDFQVKHSIILSLEDFIIMEEIRAISQILNRRRR